MLSQFGNITIIGCLINPIGNYRKYTGMNLLKIVWGNVAKNRSLYKIYN